MPPAGGEGPSGPDPADRPSARLPARRFSDEEVRRILRRATGEGAEASQVEAGDGLTLAEVEAVAAEAGIDRGAVRRAALADLPPPPPTLGSRLAGGPARFRHRVVVPGRLTTEARRELTGALERLLERELTVEDAGGYVVWEEDHRQGWTRVSAREVEGGIEAGVDADRRGWVTLAGVASAAAVGAASPFLGPLVVGGLGVPLPFFLLGAVALAFVGVRLVWGPAARRLHRTLERALGEVLARVEPGGSPPPALPPHDGHPGGGVPAP